MYKMRQLKTKSSRDSMMGYPSLPTFSLSQDQLPEAKKWQVGKKYKLEIEVEMVGTNKDEYMQKQPINHRFKVTGVAVDEEEDEGKKGYK
jgi:hypothetical protein